jgi:hypothetical protein
MGRAKKFFEFTNFLRISPATRARIRGSANPAGSAARESRKFYAAARGRGEHAGAMPSNRYVFCITHDKCLPVYLLPHVQPFQWFQVR